MTEYEQLGHMERLTGHDNPPPQLSYVIPHHAVYRESSSTSKVRVVFNASATTYSGKSLNDHLLVGPKLQADLTSIILQWRHHQYVLTADIEKMYRQILIDPKDANFQRIVWQASHDSTLQEFRLMTVTYGTASAPFLALRVLKQLATDEGTPFPLALPVLLSQTYVDDCIFGAADMDTAIRTRDQLIALLSKGGFRLRKWASNRVELLTDIDPADHGLACGSTLRLNDELTLLGILWNPDRDSFHFRLAKLPAAPHSKRGILATIARIFDPLGWLTPVVVVAKTLLQRLWQLRCDWDDLVPPAVQATWLQFQVQLPSLETIAIPRWTGYDGRERRVELHGFSDASTKAYAAVVYFRAVSVDGAVTPTLLMAKSKVAPLKTLSVPRLELCAAHLLARLISFVLPTIRHPTVKVHCWTDSTIVLAWLAQSPSRWKTFVANRVAQIHQRTNTAVWHHVPTSDNPADCASRGLSAASLQAHSLWWNGPDWLSGPAERWPTNIPGPPIGAPLEERPAASHHCIRLIPWELQHRFSSWPKLLRVTAYVMRFVQRLKRRWHSRGTHGDDGADCHSAALQPTEFLAAKHFWLRRIQDSLFSSEARHLRDARPVEPSSPLASLNPFLDIDGIIRVGGRLRNADLPASAKQPIVLSSHPLVTLIISQQHKDALHLTGPRLTLALLRQEYWLLRARAVVRAVIYGCVPCARARATIPNQLMGDLPTCRVTASPRAFSHTGVDYAGPLRVRYASGRGQKAHKAYIVLFICMTTKAIHLEVVSDYSASAFIAAYHRFVSRRGLPSVLYSDNGTTFHGAHTELRQSHQAAITHPDFANRLTTEGVEWRFIPPAAPHFGGLWEASVRSAKHHLTRCIGSHTLTLEELGTLLCRTEACLNSRPIAAVSDCLDDYHALTPGHLLIGAPLVSSPEPSVLSLRESRLSRWQLVQRLSEEWWGAWHRDYLHTLQQRPKWRIRQQLAQVGQLVLLSDPHALPSHWALGRIIECHPGDDGLTRVVTIKTAATQLKRPIVKLCFLPVDINRAAEVDDAGAGGE